MPSILLTGPAVEPITLAAAKQFIRVEHDDDDDVITALIAGSRIHVETQTRRALITQSWRLVRDVWPELGCVPVLPVPLRTFDAARVYRPDGSTLAIDLAAFTVDKAAAPARLSFTRGALPAPGRPVAGTPAGAELAGWDPASPPGHPEGHRHDPCHPPVSFAHTGAGRPRW